MAPSASSVVVVDAGGDEQTIDTQALRGGEVGAHGIADGQDARERRCAHRAAPWPVASAVP